MKLYAIAFAAMTFLTSPANAGWQYTSWGMTPEQVAAASKTKVQISNGESNDSLGLVDDKVGAVGTYTSGLYQFRAVFYFTNQKLSSISLRLQNDKELCRNLWQDMKSAYAEPFEQSRDALMRTAIWQDVAKNNRVTMREITTCSLHYEPLKNVNNAGL